MYTFRNVSRKEWLADHMTYWWTKSVSSALRWAQEKVLIRIRITWLWQWQLKTYDVWLSEMDDSLQETNSVARREFSRRKGIRKQTGILTQRRIMHVKYRWNRDSLQSSTWQTLIYIVMFLLHLAKNEKKYCNIILLTWIHFHSYEFNYSYLIWQKFNIQNFKSSAYTQFK